MPKVLEIEGYRFHFFSEEGNEPQHIHVEKGDGYAKIWLIPNVKWEYCRGFKTQEKRKIRKLINENLNDLIAAWNEYFG